MDEIYHWIPNAELGGCEMALLAFIQGSKNYRHIVVCCMDGPAVKLWQEAGAEVAFLPHWFDRLDIWSVQWRAYVEGCCIRHIILWSPSRLPWMLSGLRNRGVSRCLIHVGTNQSVGRLKTIVYLLFHFFRSPDFDVMLICCSGSVLKMAKSNLYFKVFKSKVIYNGIRKFFFEHTVDMAVGNGIAGTVGRLDYLKGHHLMIAALPAVIAQIPDFKLEIIGDGDEMERLKMLAADLGVANHVVFHGRINRVLDLEIKWGLFLFASNETEGMGIALAEALALGLPVVVSDTQVMREVVGAAGIYFKNGDVSSLSSAIIGSVLNRRLPGEMKSRALAFFHPDVFSKKYLDELFVK